MTHLTLMISRKRSRLTQKDISYFLNLKDPSSISRFEAGERSVPLEVILLYHILFSVPIQPHIETQLKQIKDTLRYGIPTLLDEISQSEPSTRNQRRIQHLENILFSLSV